MTRYQIRRMKAASAHGRRMAGRRWAKDRARRDALARLTAEQYPARIVRRIIVIDQEQIVREAVIWNWDSRRSAARKQRAVLSPSPSAPSAEIRGTNRATT